VCVCVSVCVCGCTAVRVCVDAQLCVCAGGGCIRGVPPSTPLTQRLRVPPMGTCLRGLNKVLVQLGPRSIPGTRRPALRVRHQRVGSPRPPHPTPITRWVGIECAPSCVHVCVRVCMCMSMCAFARVLVWSMGTAV
jgi:hypothetical protein